MPRIVSSCYFESMLPSSFFLSSFIFLHTSCILCYLLSWLEGFPCIKTTLLLRSIYFLLPASSACFRRIFLKKSMTKFSFISFCFTNSSILFQVPFLDPISTLLNPIIPLTPADYEEFGYPGNEDDFHAIRRYSPYDNIQKDAAYPAVLITSSFNTR